MNLWSIICGWFNRARQELWDLVHQIFTGVLEIMLANLKEIAMEVVMELAQTDLQNEEKRKIAFERIKEIATEKGIATKDSAINLMIELAVQKCKQIIEEE